MSQYGIIYRLEFKNIKDQIVRVDISPTDYLIDDADTPEIIPLTGTGSPFTVSTVNNDESKFQQIRSKQAKIEFVSNVGDGLTISTFSNGPDNLWVVTALIPTVETIFTGYLIMADNQQPFLPDPNVVVLTATDHLAVIKEIALVDYDDNILSGKYRVADLVTMCLRKTGLSLPLYVVDNLKPGAGTMLTDVANFSSVSSFIFFPSVKMPKLYVGMRFTVDSPLNSGTIFTVLENNSGDNVLVSPTPVAESGALNVTFTDELQGHWYDIVYIDSKTFEQEINLSQDCYTVLEKLLGQNGFITQWKGAWYILRIDEIDSFDYIVTEFDTDGILVGSTTQDISKAVGRAEDTKFANADTLLRFLRPHGYIRETYNYDYPLEAPCNSDFQRGGLTNTISAFEKDFNIDCWTKRRGLPGGYISPITITDYIKRLYNANGYEIERYIYITPQVGHSGFSSTDEEYIESEAIPVLINDKFTASIDWRLGVDLTTSSASPRLFRMVLHGTDGSWWVLGRPSDISGTDSTLTWYDTSGWTVNTARGKTGIVFGDQDETKWQNIEWEAPPVPVSGDLYMWVAQFYQSSTTGVNTTIYYDNLRFEYIPYANGSYQKFSGQSTQTTRPETGYLAKQENEVFISDAPFPFAKGAMFFATFEEIWNDTVDFFGTTQTIQFAGDQSGLLTQGMVIQISGTASNNQIAKILTVSYSIISDITVITIDKPVVTESVTAIISQAVFRLVPIWYDSHPFAGGNPPDASYLHPYGYIQCYAVMNQFRGAGTTRASGISIFQGTVVNFTDDWPDMLHKYSLTDTNPQTDDRLFMLISFTQDWRTCQMQCVFVEVYNTLIGKIYTDTLTLKYIAE